MANPFKVIDGLLEREQRVADFIAGPDPGGLPGHVRNGFRHRCDEFANLPVWARALSGVAGGSINRICKPYWDGAGVDGPQVSPPPFPGGQCPTNYLVQVIDPQGPTIDFSQTLLGPIGAFSVELTGPPNFLMIIRVPFAGGIAQGVVGARGPTVLDRQFQQVTRNDGQPDDCGDLPSDLEPGPNPPPDPGPLPGPEPTDNPDPDDPIPFLPIPPFLDPIFGPQPITGPDDSPVGPGGDGSGGGSGDRPPGDVGEPGGFEDTGAGGDADGAAPEGSVLTGLRINFVTPPVGGNEYRQGIFRGVCYIYMGTADGVDHDPAGAMLRDNQFVFAEKDNLTHWFVSANQGYNLRVTPYYRVVES